jgi:uncharacterized membrane protein YjgN (DUF898 family)
MTKIAGAPRNKSIVNTVDVLGFILAVMVLCGVALGLMTP